MYKRHYSLSKHCRWCGTVYNANKPYDRDGFCSKSCKQAHYRAYKNYVTAISSNKTRDESGQVTRKRRKNAR